MIDEIQRRYERDGPTTHFATNRTDFVMRQCAPIRVVSRSNANFQKKRYFHRINDYHKNSTALRQNLL